MKQFLVEFIFIVGGFLVGCVAAKIIWALAWAFAGMLITLVFIL